MKPYKNIPDAIFALFVLLGQVLCGLIIISPVAYIILFSYHNLNVNCTDQSLRILPFLFMIFTSYIMRKHLFSGKIPRWSHALYIASVFLVNFIVLNWFSPFIVATGLHWVYYSKKMKMQSITTE